MPAPATNCSANTNSSCAVDATLALAGHTLTALLAAGSDVAAQNLVLGNMTTGDAFKGAGGFYTYAFTTSGTCLAHGAVPYFVGLNVTQIGNWLETNVGSGESSSGEASSGSGEASSGSGQGASSGEASSGSGEAGSGSGQDAGLSPECQSSSLPCTLPDGTPSCCVWIWLQPMSLNISSRWANEPADLRLAGRASYGRSAVDGTMSVLVTEAGASSQAVVSAAATPTRMGWWSAALSMGADVTYGNDGSLLPMSVAVEGGVGSSGAEMAMSVAAPSPTELAVAASAARSRALPTPAPSAPCVDDPSWTCNGTPGPSGQHTCPPFVGCAWFAMHDVGCVKHPCHADDHGHCTACRATCGICETPPADPLAWLEPMSAALNARWWDDEPADLRLSGRAAYGDSSADGTMSVLVTEAGASSQAVVSAAATPTGMGWWSEALSMGSEVSWGGANSSVLPLSCSIEGAVGTTGLEAAMGVAAPSSTQLALTASVAPSSVGWRVPAPQPGRRLTSTSGTGIAYTGDGCTVSNSMDNIAQLVVSRTGTAFNATVSFYPSWGGFTSSNGVSLKLVYRTAAGSWTQIATTTLGPSDFTVNSVNT